MKLKTLTLALVLFLAPQAVFGLGIVSRKLELGECSGKVKLTGLKSVVNLNSFVSRGGEIIPAKIVARYTIEVVEQDSICDLMESELKIDFDDNSYEATQIFKSPLVKHPSGVISFKANQLLGTTYSFKAKQRFSYEENGGFLPFYPLIHKEQVVITSADLKGFSAAVPVDAIKAYKIQRFLNDDEKMTVVHKIMKYLKWEVNNGISLHSLVPVIFNHMPSQRKNIQEFYQVVLSFYDSLEESIKDTKTFEPKNLTLAAFASEFIEIIKPQFHHYIKNAEFLIKHPSLLNNLRTRDLSCLDITAIDLEEAMILVEKQINNHDMPANLKFTWNKPLKQIAGDYSIFPHSKCLKKITSSQTKKMAKKILASYY